MIQEARERGKIAYLSFDKFDLFKVYAEKSIVKPCSYYLMMSLHNSNNETF